MITFFNKVRNFYINQTPQGTAEGKCILTPRLTDWEAALRIYGIPSDYYSDYIDWSLLLFGICLEQERAPRLEKDCIFKHPTLDEWLEAVNA